MINQVQMLQRMSFRLGKKVNSSLSQNTLTLSLEGETCFIDNICVEIERERERNSLKILNLLDYREKVDKRDTTTIMVL